MQAALKSAEARLLQFEEQWKDIRREFNRQDMSVEDWVWSQEYPASSVPHFLSAGVRRTTDLCMVKQWKVRALLEALKNELEEDQQQQIIKDFIDLLEWGREWHIEMAELKKLDDEIWTDDEEEVTASESATTASASTVPSLRSLSSTSSTGTFCSLSSGKKKKRMTINPMFKKKKKRANQFEKPWYKIPGSNVQCSPPPCNNGWK